KSLFFILGDLAMNGATQTRLIQLDAKDGSLVRTWTGFTSLGGDIAPDGKSYVMVEIRDGRGNLSRLDLGTGQRTLLTHFDTDQSIGGPAVAPDGKRVAFVRQMENGFELFVLQPDGTHTRLTHD